MGLMGDRDRALLALGWFGAFRRAELVSLDAGDVVRGDEGLVVTLRRSKGDQEGHGATKGIPYASLPAVCPVRALARWLEASGIAEGPIFRGIDRHGHVQAERLHPCSVARVVKRCAERAGLDPEKFAGHSLRAGFATTASQARQVARREHAADTPPLRARRPHVHPACEAVRRQRSGRAVLTVSEPEAPRTSAPRDTLRSPT